MTTSRTGPPRRSDRHSASAARQIRFDWSSGTPATLHSIANGPSRGMQRIVSCSEMRLEDGAQLVKAVGPHPEHAKIEIDLGVSANRDGEH